MQKIEISTYSLSSYLLAGNITLSLESDVEQMLNDMMEKEGWTRSHTLSVLRSKFESEERYQEVEYINNLMRKEDTKNSD
jgi:hypothetical protein